MYRTILVPLDGSIMAEQAVLPAGDIARRVGASLLLAVAHPWGPPEDAPFAGTGADEALRHTEHEYLDRIRARVETFGVPAEVVLLEGDPVAALGALVAERRVDLVVGSTHGRGALARVLRGGVAIRIAHGISCPALLLKPLRESSAVPDANGFTRILVPLDGSRAAETSLEPALALAAARHAVLLLLRVLSPGREDGGTLADRRLDATRYLNWVAGRLEQRGVRVETRVVTRRAAGPGIVNLAGRWGADLLAITTRERGEGERLVLGSVADLAVERAPMPVLVCHATVRQTAEEAAIPLIPGWRRADALA
ncbi:MAG TPA: universal stress protein [Gemmatimonadales bacterium]|nr:universal stress protein [Gemmatimonadales bacterium]